MSAVVALAAASVAFGSVGSKDAPKEMLALTRVHALKAAVETYCAKNKGELPSSVVDIVELLPEKEKGVLDPWGQAFQFELKTEGGKTHLRIWTTTPGATAREYGLRFLVPEPPR